MSSVRLDGLISRRARRSEDCESIVRRTEIQRLARAIRQTDDELTANNRQLTKIDGRVAPELQERRGIDPASAG